MNVNSFQYNSSNHIFLLCLTISCSCLLHHLCIEPSIHLPPFLPCPPPYTHTLRNFLTITHCWKVHGFLIFLSLTSLAYHSTVLSSLGTRDISILEKREGLHPSFLSRNWIRENCQSLLRKTLQETGLSPT